MFEQLTTNTSQADWLALQAATGKRVRFRPGKSKQGRCRFTPCNFVIIGGKS